MKDEFDTAVALEPPDADAFDARDEDRAGYEMVRGAWVPKHPPAPPDGDRPGCELVSGTWTEKGMSSAAGLVESNVHFALQAHARARRSGFVFSESAAYQLFATDAKLLRKPDVSFVRFGRLPGDAVPHTGRMVLAPDLAVEVISPTDLADAVNRKLDEYLRAGVRLVWFAYVPTRSVWAYRPDGSARLYRTGDALPGEDVLEGFAVPVADLFAGVADEPART